MRFCLFLLLLWPGLALADCAADCNSAQQRCMARKDIRALNLRAIACDRGLRQCQQDCTVNQLAGADSACVQSCVGQQRRCEARNIRSSHSPADISAIVRECRARALQCRFSCGK